MSTVWYILIFAVIAAAIYYVAANFVRIRKMPEGTDDMVEMAGIIRSGASTFLKTEFRTIAIVSVVVALLLSLFVERTAGLTFLLGALMSSVVCILGMRSATYANVRTANKARESLSIGETVKVALCGGSISGLSVQAFGLFGLLIVVLFGGISHDAPGSGLLADLGGVNATIMRISTYSLGCSLVAMFNRVAGGNYTKAADISADILAKVRNDLPEDDSRVPNVIADFIGDNVNDIAGNCSDLLESFVATMAATIMIGVILFSSAVTRLPASQTAAAPATAIVEQAEVPEEAGLPEQAAATVTDPAIIVDPDLTRENLEGVFKATTTFPIVMAGLGLLSCLAGLFYAARKKMSDDPSKELNLATWISAGLTLVLGFFASLIIFSGQNAAALADYGFKAGWISPWICIILGIVSGVAIGSITEYYTSTDFPLCKKLHRKEPTTTLAEITPEGEAFVVTKGDAIGSRSVLLPVLVIGVALLISGLVCGTYGVAVAALGMLSFVGATVSIDAFGPIADNAGGLAESCHLPHDVRRITDKLDAVGNTTAAVGKGFAIGSAAFATVSLIVSYVGNYTIAGHEPILNIASFVVVAGAIIGGALVEYFCAMLTDNTIESAKLMADEGDRQLTPAVLAGQETPDYNKMIQIAAKQALRKMLVPSILAMVIPIIGGFLFGVNFVGGLLIGATIVAIPRALFMGNSGGAFDNAKKYIESDSLPGHGKGSAAHKAAVTGDTIGDTRKDVVGVALDIFIKMMSTVANTLVSVIRSITLFRG